VAAVCPAVALDGVAFDGVAMLDVSLPGSDAGDGVPAAPPPTTGV
jgi:hypothetical protein